jgi:membrane protease YdiL (CAAX protease family)
MRQELRTGSLDDETETAGRNAAAKISMRAVTALEIASVVVSILIAVWAVIPLQPDRRWLIYIPGALALALIVNSQRIRGESLRDLGFTGRHFARTLKLLLWPTLLAAAVFVSIGYSTGSIHRNTNFWATVFFLPIWGMFQQYILQGFIYRRVRFLLVDETAPVERRKSRTNLAIIVSSAIFAFVHLPNPILTILTLIGGMVWSWIYERAPNLFALGLSHGLMSLMLMTTMPPWLLESMSVGYKHFLYQKF